MKRALYVALGLLGMTVLVCNRGVNADARLQAQLTQHTGVWEGTYTYMTPSGTLLDRHASRQEARLDGRTWHQRIVYRWPDGRTRTLDFTAHIRDGKLIYEDPDFEGYLVGLRDGLALYQGAARDGSRRLVETLVTIDADHQTRSWQVFEDSVWTQVVTIDEYRVGRAE